MLSGSERKQNLNYVVFMTEDKNGLPRSLCFFQHILLGFISSALGV